MLPWVIVTMLLTVIFPFNVIPLVLLIVRLLRFVTLPGIVTPEDDPPNDKLEVAAVIRLLGVPAMAGPFNARVFAPTLKLPDVSVSVPANVHEPFSPTPLALFIVRLFKAATLDGMPTPAELPPNTRFDEEVVDKLAGVPAIAGPFRVSVLAPTANVPAVSVSPFVIVTDEPKLTPFELFMITPPVPPKVAGNSGPVVCSADPLY